SSQQQKDEFAKIQVDDPEIKALAAQLGVSPGELQAKLRGTESVYFRQLIKDLPEEQQNKLTFAHMNPDSANSLSPELKKLLGEINKAITDSITSDTSGLLGFKFSEDWAGVKPDNSEFTDKTTAEFDSAFEGALSGMVDGKQITSEQALNLRTMHYMPGSFSNNPALQSLFSKVEKSVVSDLQAKYGSGVDWAPKADSNYLKQVANGFFSQNFQEQLKNYKPPLSTDQQQEIMNLYADPKLTPSSGEIGNIAKSITSIGMAATIQKFGLDGTWQPVVGPIINPNLDPVAFKMATDALDTGNKLLDKFKTMVDGMPAGPLKSAYIDYLKVIGETLGKLQEFLYSLNSADSERSKKLSKANMETTIADIKRAQAQADEAKAKQADTKTLNLGPLSDISNWISQIVSLAVAFCMGPVFFAVALFYFIDKAVAEANGKPSITQNLFAELNTAVGPGGASAISGLLAVVLSGGNPMMGLSLMGDAKTIQNFVEACGGDKMAQEITAAVFNGVSQIVVMVALTLATGGAAAPSVLAQVTATIGKALSATTKAIESATKILNTTLNIVNITFTVAMGALTATQQGLQCNWEFVQAEVVKILSKSEAASEQVKVLISTLKKLIDKLLATMDGTSEDILMISKTQGKKYTDASAITAELQG
ncbi:MAG: hypothetical protein H0X29_07350, partial [Parachlamydiaceae bacterium]|nr:hypothetical protein [Parachlamydiaceae bacterium]